jgi:glycosyltransferase involved in cell wall biosynthesis
MKRLSVIAPVHNEALGILRFVQEVERVFLNHCGDNWICSLVLVDDGSTDRSWEIMKSSGVSIPLRLIKLTRNFGHQQAVWAGLSAVPKDDFSIVLDSDFQDPPSIIPRILSEFERGFDTVLLKRTSRQDGLSKRFFASVYYRIQAWLSGTHVEKNVADFFGLSPRAKDSLLLHDESVKYIRGLVAQLGYKTSVIEYSRDARLAGKTHYTISKMFSLALAGITGFSISPLILVVYAAIFGGATAVIFGVYVFYLKVYSNEILQPGWASLSISLLLLSALTLFSLAVISLYLARVIQEIKRRPLFLVEEDYKILEDD